MTEAEQATGTGPAKPTTAGVYDVYLGGSHHTQLERETAHKLRELMPDVEAMAWANRSGGHEIRGLPWNKVDDLSAGQLAAMQTMDDARREGVLSDADAHVIEDLIRAGHVHGARKRVSSARRRAQPGPGG